MLTTDRAVRARLAAPDGRADASGGPMVARRLVDVLLERGRARGRRRELRRIDDGLPELLDGIARALRSGASLPQAFAEGCTRADDVVRASLVDAGRALELGSGLAGALERWAMRYPTPSVRLTVAALTLGLEAGGTTAQAVDAVASRVRDRLLLAREVAASTAQARASVAVLVAAPPFAAVVLGGVDQRSVGFLVGSPAGWLLLTVALALDGVGWWWMRSLIERVV